MACPTSALRTLLLALSLHCIQLAEDLGPISAITRQNILVEGHRKLSHDKRAVGLVQMETLTPGSP